MLRPQAIDAIASNAMCLAPAGYNLFDLEWTLEGEMPASWFILRNVLTLRRITIRQDSKCPYPSFRDLYFTLCRCFDIEPAIRTDLRREASFQAAARGTRVTWAQIHSLLSELHKPFTQCLMPRRARDLLRLQNRHARLEGELAELQAQYNAALNSASYLRGLEVTRLMARFPWLHRIARRAYRLTHPPAAVPDHPPASPPA